MQDNQDLRTISEKKWQDNQDLRTIIVIEQSVDLYC